jgi:hypothetical protein
MFNLEIGNYNKQELEEILNLTGFYRRQEVITNYESLCIKIKNNRNMNIIDQEQMITFLGKVKDTMLVSLSGEDITTNNTNINPIISPKICKYLSIDTRFRENYNGTKSTDFSIHLPIKLNNVISMSLNMIEPLISYYTISDKLSNNFIIIEVDGTKETITVPNGNYLNKTSTLITALNDSIATTSHNNKILFTYDNVDIEKIILQCDNGTTIKMLCDENGDIDCDSETRIEMKLGWILGFRSKYYELQTTNVNKKIKAEGIIDTRGPSYMYLTVNDYQNNVDENIYSVAEHNMIVTNIIARISLLNKADPLSTITNPERRYFGPVDISKLTFRLTDEYGRTVQPNDNDYSFSIKLQCNYEN